MYLFDTCILSEVVKRNPHPGLIERLAQVPPEQQHTTTITVGEMVYGAFKSDRPDYFLALARERIWPTVRILPFDVDAAQTYGRLRAELERAGTPVSEPDLRIASIAVVHRLTVVTRNTHHFQHVPGLSVENWI